MLFPVGNLDELDLPLQKQVLIALDHCLQEVLVDDAVIWKVELLVLVKAIDG